MFFRQLARSLALLAALSLALPALSTCGGASFDDPGKIKGLRVLAVQKSAPYPKQGELVNLKLLFWDGKSTEDNPRNINVLFLSDILPLCTNPDGDLYFNCFAPRDGGARGGGMSDAGVSDGGRPDDADVPDADNPDADVPDAVATRGSTPLPFVATQPTAAPGVQDPNHIRETNVLIPGDVIVDRAPGVERYGLVYVLFMACAGTPRPLLNAGPNKLPFGCFDAEGRELGADDFVLGYTSMYVFEDRANMNPVIDDFLLDSASLAGSTTDENVVRHIASCKESDRSKCPKHPLKPVINKDLTDEPDTSAKGPDGQTLREQAWVNYYITAGELNSSVRLVNDATRGWNEKNEAEYTAPAEPGPVRLFAVVHDNRGGVAWVEGKIIVD
jgi:hypothetical protein